MRLANIVGTAAPRAAVLLLILVTSVPSISAGRLTGLRVRVTP
ncbi:MAG: hypothetical protein ABGW90_05430 [Martelella sp.]|tara:strand:+ start:181 stop:309 length:129 start_codon:yes stop_codon:yes gene_type:complete